MSVEKFFLALEALNSVSLRHRPEAEAQVKLAHDITAAFQQLSEAERREVSDQLAGSESGRKLVSLGGCLSEVAVNKHDQSLITQALLLQVIEDFRDDYRESIRHLVLIEHAALRIGTSIAVSLGPISHLLSWRARKKFFNFRKQEYEPENLAAFGMREDNTPGAFQFVPIPDPFQRPRRSTSSTTE